jgi:16S rRNA processing protein RimM
MLPGKQAHVTFQDVDNLDQIEMLTGAALYLPVEALPELGENEFYYHEINGYMVVDHKYGELGTVEKVLDYPMQALLQLRRGEKEILIPVADEIITAVDKKNRSIHIKAPEGLIEMYLE